MLEEWYYICTECDHIGTPANSMRQTPPQIHHTMSEMLKVTCESCGGDAHIDFVTDVEGCVIILNEADKWPRKTYLQVNW